MISTNYAPKSKDKVSHPKLLDSLSNIIKIICGRDHCLAITSNFEVLAWGNNDKGQLGIPQDQNGDAPPTLEEQFIVSYPTRINSLLKLKIDNVATGSDHSFAWSSETGEVYAWGSGASGKLGFGGNQDYSEPHLLDCFNEASSVGLRVREIVCGDEHSLAILENVEEEDNNHKLFVWGCTKSWQLGLEEDFPEDVLEPHGLDTDPWDGKIRHIGACNNYSCCVTANGEVYTWGSGEFGRLGYETETRQQRVPRMVKDLENIVKVSLGIHHAVALTSNGLLFSWGRGINGQLGHGEIANESHPKLVKALSEKKIVDISCGENHTLSVTENGEVFSWGAGQFGQLGHGDLLRQSVPMKVNIEESVKITQTSAGRRHSVALDDKGRVFVWGCNDLCQLGLKTIGGNNALKKTNQMFAERSRVLMTLSDSNSPKEMLSTDRGNYRHPLLSIDTLTPDNFTFSPPQWQSNEKEKQLIGRQTNKEQRPVEEIIEENKFLRNRIKELELKENVGIKRGQQQNMYDLTMQYVGKIEEECSGKKGNTMGEIITKNAKIDTAYKEFRQVLKDMNVDDVQTMAFCTEMLERVCTLKKKSNYAVCQ